jgi:hypothetical protein
MNLAPVLQEVFLPPHHDPQCFDGRRVCHPSSFPDARSLPLISEQDDNLGSVFDGVNVRRTVVIDVDSKGESTLSVHGWYTTIITQASGILAEVRSRRGLEPGPMVN